MNIGVTCTLKSHVTAPHGAPEDALVEYDSDTTLTAVRQALERLGHTVRPLGYGRALLENLLARRPDLVFNFAEGVGGRSRAAQVPAVLEMLGVPYTHSDPLTLGVTQDKAMAKRIVASHGLATPRSQVIALDGTVDAALALRFPVIAKPLFEGSSMGIRRDSRVEAPDALARKVQHLLATYREPVLVEEFCPGPEFTVAVLGHERTARVLGVAGLRALRVPQERFVYSLEIKQSADWAAEVAIESPPPAPAETLAAVEALALHAYRALGCRDVGRVDIRLDADGKPCFLELNALPGLVPEWSDLAFIARGANLDYDGLIAAILEGARQRLGL